MRTRTLRTTVLAAGLLLTAFAAPAAAKEFKPGDLRLCNARSCVPIVDRGVLNALSRFYYGVPAPAKTRAPRVGAPYFQLRFSNDYVTGIAATKQFDRFRSFGVNDDQFNLEDWYRVPPKAALGLRKLAAKLRALHVTRSTIGPVTYG